MGKLICIEGGDGSGKETQTGRLFQRLLDDRYKILKVEYPNYASESSALVKMYLNGDFGSRPEDVSPYIASTFYALDRYASYKKEWERFYQDGGIVLADRYTTANMIHQASKIMDEVQREEFLQWLHHFEFQLLGLPEPDCVIFLDVPPQYSAKLIRERKNKITGKADKDIHEKDSGYMEQAYKSSLWVAQKYNWNRIACVEGERIRSIEEIHEEVYGIVKKIV
jgi:dTMP kinase